MKRWDLTARGRLFKARARVRRRREADSPWYDRSQVDIPPELRELQRLYWRALKRQQRDGDVPRLPEVSRLVARARQEGRFPGLREYVRELTIAMARE